MARTRIGERRYRIRVEKPVKTRGTSGQEILSWETVCEVWAAVKDGQTGSREEVMGDQPIAQTSTVFDIRYRDGLNEKMRVVFNEIYYDILYFNNPDFRESTLIFAQKQV